MTLPNKIILNSVHSIAKVQVERMKDVFLEPLEIRSSNITRDGSSWREENVRLDAETRNVFGFIEEDHIV